MTVGVVIVVAGRPVHLQRTLASLAQQHTPADDVVVVDMAGDDVTAGLVEASAIARVVPLDPAHRDAGPGWPLAAARNTGAARSTAARLVFLDVDCLAAPDAIGAYGAALERHPRSLACGPVRYLCEGWAETPDEDDAAGPPVGGWSEARLADLSDLPAARLPPDPSTPPAWDHELFWSLAFGIHHEVWDELGGFDERYVGYGAEDTDFGQRARAAGVPMRWLAGGTVFHQWHPPSRDVPANHGAMVDNARRYRERWGAWPMAGWLRDLERRGRVRFGDDDATIELVEPEPAAEVDT